MTEELKSLIGCLARAKRYRRVTGTDERVEITLVFQEQDYLPIREALAEYEKAQTDG